MRLRDGKIIYYDKKLLSYEYYVEDVKYSTAKDFFDIVAELYIHLGPKVVRIEESVVNGVNVIKIKKK